MSLGTDTNLEDETYYSMTVTTATDNTSTSKRVFLRLHSSAAPKETEIIDAFLSNSGCSGVENDQLYIHYEPPQSSHFHIITDMNYAQNHGTERRTAATRGVPSQLRRGKQQAVSTSERIDLALNLL